MYSFTKKQSLSKILNGFSKTIGDLETFTVETSATISETEERIAALEVESRTLRDENDRAKKITEKLKDLIGD